MVIKRSSHDHVAQERHFVTSSYSLTRERPDEFFWNELFGNLDQTNLSEYLGEWIQMSDLPHSGELYSSYRRGRSFGLTTGQWLSHLRSYRVEYLQLFYQVLLRHDIRGSAAITIINLSPCRGSFLKTPLTSHISIWSSRFRYSSLQEEKTVIKHYLDSYQFKNTKYVLTFDLARAQVCFWPLAIYLVRLDYANSKLEDPLFYIPDPSKFNVLMWDSIWSLPTEVLIGPNYGQVVDVHNIRRVITHLGVDYPRFAEQFAPGLNIDQALECLFRFCNGQHGAKISMITWLKQNIPAHSWQGLPILPDDLAQLIVQRNEPYAS